MAVDESRAWVEHLSVDECWHLLTQYPVGRIGVLVDSAPEIYPVNHVVDDRTIVFRTDPGSKLHGLDRSPSVCYQLDELSLAEHAGWSVLVKGRAAEITEPAAVRLAAALPLRPWSIGEKAHWVRITPHEVTGLRIHHTGPDGIGR